MTSQNFGAFKWLRSSPPKNLDPENPDRITSQFPRGRVDELISGVEISKSSSSSTSTPSTKSGLPKDLAKSLRINWPNWSSMSKTTGPSIPIQLNFTVKISRNYHEMADNIDDPLPLFNEVSNLINEIRQKKTPAHEEFLTADLKEGLMNIVFSSNYIERAGCDLRETMKICQRIFDGEDVKAEDIDERSEEDHVIRSRREVIQHAKALDHITRAIAIRNEPLTEGLIKETHRILVTGIDRDDTGHGRGVTPWQKYGEIYRDVPIIAGTTSFVVPKHIPKKMVELVEKFNADIAEAERTEHIDPFYLAAKYSNMFILIHPFLDGNGRTCRLILNAILLKYAGTVIAFGEHDDAREEYFGIVKRAAEDVSDDQSEFAAFVVKKASIRLRRLREKSSGFQ